MTFAQFVQQNMFLFSLLVLVLSAIIAYEVKYRGQGGTSLTVLAASQLVNEGAVLIDTRAAADFRKGHIAGAKNYPAEGFAEQMKKLEKFKNKALVLYCQNGMSSPAQAKTLRSAGFASVYVIQGGLESWLQDNLPLVK